MNAVDVLAVTFPTKREAIRSEEFRTALTCKVEPVGDHADPKQPWQVVVTRAALASVGGGK